MKKQLTAMLLALLLCMGLVVTASAAAQTGATGDCTWTYDATTQTLTISGNGATGSARMWWSNGFTVSTLIIDEGVTEIGASLFLDCTSLKSVTIPSSVKKIGSSAFYGCSSLDTVKYMGTEDSVTLGTNVFVGTDVTEILVPEDYEDNEFCRMDVNKTLPPVTPPTIYTVTVSNDGNGSGTAVPSSGETGQEVVLTATPNDGYRFKEWKVIAGGVEITNHTLNIGAANVEVKAIFELIPPQTYTVSFNPNGGSGTMDLQTFTAGVPQNLMSNAFTFEGFIFDGWNTAADGSGTAFEDGEAVTVSSDMGLYAQWKAIPAQPQTGDSSALLLWLTMSILSVAGILFLRKKAYG